MDDSSDASQIEPRDDSLGGLTGAEASATGLTPPVLEAGEPDAYPTVAVGWPQERPL